MTEPLIDLLTGRPVEKWAQDAVDRSAARRRTPANVGPSTTDQPDFEALSRTPAPSEPARGDGEALQLLDERIANYSALRDECVEAGTNENGYALAVEALDRVRQELAASLSGSDR